MRIGTLFTSVEAIQRFCEALTAVALDGLGAGRAAGAITAKRLAQVQRALDEAGI